MKSFMTAILLLGICAGAAETVFKIEVGSKEEKYTDRELRRRVWELERAVAQLQEKVFHLEEGSRSAPKGDSWVCTIKAFGDTYTATGGSKAVAIHNVVEECKKKRKDGFFCKDPACEQ